MLKDPIELLRASIEELQSDIENYKACIKHAKNGRDHQINWLEQVKKETRQAEEYYGKEITKHENSIANAENLIKMYEEAIAKLGGNHE